MLFTVYRLPFIVKIMQLIIVYIILGLSITYAIYAIIKYIRKKEKSPCDGCDGCELKNQIAKNMRNKITKDPETCVCAENKHKIMEKNLKS